MPHGENATYRKFHMEWMEKGQNGKWNECQLQSMRHGNNLTLKDANAAEAQNNKKTKIPYFIE